MNTTLLKASEEPPVPAPVATPPRASEPSPLSQAARRELDPAALATLRLIVKRPKLSSRPSYDANCFTRPSSIRAVAAGSQTFRPEMFTVRSGTRERLKDLPAEDLFIFADAALAEQLNAQVQDLKRTGKQPFLDVNHSGGTRAAEVDFVFWAGTDPTEGGVRLISRWTPSGSFLLSQMVNWYFSPAFFFKRDRGEIRVRFSSECLGAIVQEGAFRRNLFLSYAAYGSDPERVYRELLAFMDFFKCSAEEAEERLRASCIYPPDFHELKR
jgi:hypothetical protein